MSRIEQEEKKKSNEQNSRQRYENLNNNELKFKKLNTFKINKKIIIIKFKSFLRNYYLIYLS